MNWKRAGMLRGCVGGEPRSAAVVAGLPWGLFGSLGLMLGLGLGAGCQAKPSRPNLQSERAAEKVPALVDQTQRGDSADYDALVLALDDADPAIRFAAAQSLRELTDEDFGYRYFDGRLERQDAVARWRDWLVVWNGGEPASGEREDALDAIAATPDSGAGDSLP